MRILVRPFGRDSLHSLHRDLEDYRITSAEIDFFDSRVLGLDLPRRVPRGGLLLDFLDAARRFAEIEIFEVRVLGERPLVCQRCAMQKCEEWDDE